MPELQRSVRGAPEARMNLFLDTNTYLAFFKLSGDDLEELEKLVVAVRSGRTKLYLTRQVRHEYRRNRATAIRESLKHVEDSRLPTAFPRLFEELEGYAEMRGALTEYERRRASLLDEGRHRARDRSLQADRRIAELFGLATELAKDDEVLVAASQRHAIGNPPGKKDSLGDAINWESLLAGVPDGEDLIIVSGDRDYSSALDDGLLDEFLADEWSETKGTQVTLHRRLTDLFRAHYPHIRLAADLEKEFAIDSLIASPNFRSTHLAIARLRNYAEFTPDQVGAITEAATTNSQVANILGDSDVRAFYTELLERYPDDVDPTDLAWIREQLTASHAATDWGEW